MYSSLPFDKHEQLRSEREQLRITRQQYGIKLASSRQAAKFASKETNKRRRAQEEKRKRQEQSEETRRQEILEQRKALHRHHVEQFRKRSDAAESRKPANQDFVTRKVAGSTSNTLNFNTAGSNPHLPRRSFHGIAPEPTDLDEALRAIRSTGTSGIGLMTNPVESQVEPPPTVVVGHEARSQRAMSADNSEQLEVDDTTQELDNDLAQHGSGLDSDENCQVSSPSDELTEDSCSEVEGDTTKAHMLVSPLKNPLTQQLFEQPATISLEGSGVARRLFSPKQRPTSPAWEAAAGERPSSANQRSLSPDRRDLNDSLEDANSFAEQLGKVLEDSDIDGDEDDSLPTPVGSDQEDHELRASTPYHHEDSSSQAEDFSPNECETPEPEDYKMPILPSVAEPSNTESNAMSLTSSALRSNSYTTAVSSSRTQPFYTVDSAARKPIAPPSSVGMSTSAVSSTTSPTMRLASQSVDTYAGEVSTRHPPRSVQPRSVSLSALHPASRKGYGEKQPDPKHDPKPRGILKSRPKRNAHPASAGREALQDHLSRMQRAHSDGQLGMRRGIQFLDHDIILNDMEKQTPPPVHQGPPTASSPADRQHGRVQPPVFHPRGNFMTTAQRKYQAEARDRHPPAPMATGSSTRQQRPVHPSYPSITKSQPSLVPTQQLPYPSLTKSQPNMVATSGQVPTAPEEKFATSNVIHVDTPAPAPQNNARPTTSSFHEHADGVLRPDALAQQYAGPRVCRLLTREDIEQIRDNAKVPPPPPRPNPSRSRMRKPPTPTPGGGERIAFGRSLTSTSKPPPAVSTAGIPPVQSASSSSVRRTQGKFRLQLNQQVSASLRSSNSTLPAGNVRPQNSYTQALPAPPGPMSYSRMLEGYGAVNNHTYPVAEKTTVPSAATRHVPAWRRLGVAEDNTQPKPMERDLVQQEREILKSLEHIDQMLLENSASSAFRNGSDNMRRPEMHTQGQRGIGNRPKAASQRNPRAHGGAPSPVGQSRSSSYRRSSTRSSASSIMGMPKGSGYK